MNIFRKENIQHDMDKRVKNINFRNKMYIEWLHRECTLTIINDKHETFRNDR